MTIDPIVQAAGLVLDLQTLVSRELKPTDPAVVTVGSIHGGSQHNVISDSCRLQITVRCYSAEVRQHLLEGIARKAKAVASGARAPEPTIEIGRDSLSAVFNDEALTGRCVGALRPLLGEDKLVPSEPAMMGEDFSRYGEAGVPIVMLRLGSIERVRLKALTRGGMQPPSLHSALYYPDPEPTLVTGVAAMSSIALDLLKPTGRKPASGAAR